MQEFRRYTPNEQEKILREAIHMQATAAGDLTRDEIVQVALEAGVRPEYVYQAIDRLERPTRNVAGSEQTLTFALVGLLVVFQWLGSFSLFGDTLQSFEGLQWWGVIGLCVAIGAAKSRSKKDLLASLRLVLGSALVVSALCGAFVHLTRGGVDSNWLRYSVNIVAAQLLAVSGSGLLARFLRRFDRKTRAVEADPVS